MLELVLLLVTWLALTPQPVPMPPAEAADNLAHLLALLVLALLDDGGWPDQRFGWRTWLPMAGYEMAIELVRTQIPNRFFSIGDRVAGATPVVPNASLVRHGLKAASWR